MKLAEVVKGRENPYDLSMQNLASGLPYKGREGLSRSLKCHLSGSFFYRLVWGATIFLGLFFTIDVLMPLLTGHFRFILRWASLLEFLGVGILLCAALILRETHRIHIQLHGDHFFFEGQGRVGLQVAFSDVLRVRFARSKKLIPGFFLDLKSGASIHIPLFLERVDYVMDAMKFYRPELCGTAEFIRFRRYGVLTDHMVSHQRQHFAGSKFKYIGVLLATPFIYRHQEARLAKDPTQVRRNIDYEQRLHRLCQIVFLVAITGFIALKLYAIFHH